MYNLLLFLLSYFLLSDAVRLPGLLRRRGPRLLLRFLQNNFIEIPRNHLPACRGGATTGGDGRGRGEETRIQSLKERQHAAGRACGAKQHLMNNSNRQDTQPKHNQTIKTTQTNPNKQIEPSGNVVVLPLLPPPPPPTNDTKTHSNQH